MLGALFPVDQIAVVNGDAAVGAAFSALPFDHLIFTGSTAVGHKVMQAASQHLVPITLELGGKSPVIVEIGHPLDHASAGIVFGRLVTPICQIGTPMAKHPISTAVAPAAPSRSRPQRPRRRASFAIACSARISPAKPSPTSRC
jgi:hypothetical protein